MGGTVGEAYGTISCTATFLKTRYVISETNRTRFDLSGIQNRAFGPNFMTNNRVIVSAMTVHGGHLSGASKWSLLDGLIAELIRRKAEPRRDIHTRCAPILMPQGRSRRVFFHLQLHNSWQLLGSILVCYQGSASTCSLATSRELQLGWWLNMVYLAQTLLCGELLPQQLLCYSHPALLAYRQLAGHAARVNP
jgi:hypothetical protein